MKYEVVKEFWFKKHGRIYHVGETAELTEIEAKAWQSYIKEIRDRKTKPFTDYNKK